MPSTTEKNTVLKTNTLEGLCNIQAASALIYIRNLAEELKAEISTLLEVMSQSTIKFSGDAAEITQQLKEVLKEFPLLQADILDCVAIFTQTTECQSIEGQLSSIKNDMCRRFHTDAIDYRLLCTYAGVGTYYVLPEAVPQNLNQEITQFETLAIGDVIIFRGAMSATADFPPLLHKSPPVQALGIERLLLRLDTVKYFF